MAADTKTVQAELLGLKGHPGYPNVTVEITHKVVDQSNKYITKLTIPAYKPEFDSIEFTLKLTDEIQGVIMLHMSGFPQEDIEETHFMVVFHDPIWKSTDWFEKL